MHRFLFAVLLITPFLLIAQAPPPECKDLHTGTFYHYSLVDNNHGVYIREDGVQKEIHLETGDTAVWKISWPSDCRYRLIYVSGNKVWDSLARLYPKSFDIDVQITGTTPMYYLYKAVVQGKGGPETTSDTLWREDHPEKRIRKNIVQAAFPGGLEAWQRYLVDVFGNHRREINKMKTDGVCYVRFFVDTNGKVGEVTALSMQGTPFAKIAVDAVQNGPDWIPGTVDGVVKKMFKIQPIKFQVKYE